MTAEPREDTVNRPCLIVAHGDPGYASQVSRAFRRLGWDVYSATTGPEARRLTRMLYPDLLVMGTELDGESGWLTCEKVLGEQPNLKVFLVGDSSRPANGEFANFVGAVALLPQMDSVQALIEEIDGSCEGTARQGTEIQTPQLLFLRDVSVNHDTRIVLLPLFSVAIASTDGWAVNPPEGGKYQETGG